MSSQLRTTETKPGRFTEEKTICRLGLMSLKCTCGATHRKSMESKAVYVVQTSASRLALGCHHDAIWTPATNGTAQPVLDSSNICSHQRQPCKVPICHRCTQLAEP